MKCFSSNLLLILLLAFCSMVNADSKLELRQAQKLLAAGDYEQAFEVYQRIANEEANPLARHTMAMFYDFGWGRPVDRSKACEWYALAAQGDIPAAADALAHCLAEGVDGEVDFKQAADWYQKAVDLGHHVSLCSLGALYIAGRGVNQDGSKGLALCQQSAEQGSVPSMLLLAEFYRDDENVRDYAQALHWFSTAASYQSVVAQYQLAVMLRDGKAGEKNPEAARAWFEQAANQGYVPAYFETAQLYFNAPLNPETGLWYENDLAKTYMWLKASQQVTIGEKQSEQLAMMLTKVRDVMPKTWEPELDMKVVTHLKRFSNADAQDGKKEISQ